MATLGLALRLALLALASTGDSDTDSTAAHHQEGQRVGLHFAGATAVGNVGRSLDTGFGFGLHGGWQLNVGRLTFRPEMIVNIYRFTTGSEYLSQRAIDEFWIFMFGPGGRIGYVVGPAMPWVGGHVGFGQSQGRGAFCDVFGQECASKQFGSDVGAGLDWEVASRLRLGLFVSVNFEKITLNFPEPSRQSSTANWVAIGVSGTYGRR